MTDKSKLLERKRIGDIEVVAKMVNETRDNTAKIMRRPGAKKYEKVMGALEKVIESRESVITESSQTN